MWIYDGDVRIAYEQTLVARYRGTYDRRQKRLKAVRQPTLYHTAFASPQLELFELDDDQWRKVIERLPPHRRRLSSPTAIVEQLAFALTILVVYIISVLYVTLQRIHNVLITPY